MGSIDVRQPALDLRGVSKIYRDGAIQLHALRGVNLQVTAGEFVAILGPSGAGKSTLLNVLGLLEEFESGQYALLGTNAAGLNEREKARLRNRALGFVFQSYNLIPDMTLEENLELPLTYAGFSRAEREGRVDACLDEHGLTNRRTCFPAELSGGQQQRVAIARALIMRPAIVLADEPTGNLDSLSARQVMQALIAHKDAGATIVMVTHSEELARYADRRFFMLDGKLSGETAADSVHRVAGERVLGG